MDIVFSSDMLHKITFDVMCRKMRPLDDGNLAFAYLISLDYDTRNHVKDIYDFDTDSIYKAALSYSWQTEKSLKVTKLAIALRGDCIGDPADYLPLELFDSEYLPYFLEAIKLRFNRLYLR